MQAGTGTAANYGCPAAGKTGTTDEGKDAWFVGYTPKLSTAVWVGYPDAGIAMPGAQGGTLAAPVWNAFMVPAHGEDCSDFTQPETAFESAPFYGKYSSTGSSSSSGGGTYYPPSTGDDTERLRRRAAFERAARLRPEPLRVTSSAGARAGAPPEPAPTPRRRAARAVAKPLPTVAGAWPRGELALIEAIRGVLGAPGERVVRWIGDDAAVVRAAAVAVTSIDTVAEDVHFSLATHCPADVGHKALASRALRPGGDGSRGRRGLRLARPAGRLCDRVRARARARHGGARADDLDTTIAGGDVVRAGALVITVAVTGWADAEESSWSAATARGRATSSASPARWAASAAGLLVLDGTRRRGARGRGARRAPPPADPAPGRGTSARARREPRR